jgi:hypothetical protein
MQIGQALEGVDLIRAHTLLTLVGAMLAVYVMSLTSYEHEDAKDPTWLRWARRSVLAMMAWSFLWSLSYSETKNWQPWPPEILMLLSMIGYLGVRASAIHARIWREGHRSSNGKATGAT